ncbi:MAG: NADH-quinone oxidoreductase subunit C, partial [Lysobacter sp.]|nr:NADH-quinone oxidoreductase subunit C [Lysobacter sp.]
MNAVMADFVDALRARFDAAMVTVAEPRGEVTIDIDPPQWCAAAQALRDEFGFEQLVDVCGVDYLSYGSDEWDTDVSYE